MRIFFSKKYVRTSNKGLGRRMKVSPTQPRVGGTFWISVDAVNRGFDQQMHSLVMDKFFNSEWTHYVSTKNDTKRHVGFQGLAMLSAAFIWTRARFILRHDFFSLSIVLVLVLIKDHFFIKRMLATWHPYTRASILCQWLQSDTGERMLSSPPASPLPKYGRNRIRAGRRTKIQPKGGLD